MRQESDPGMSGDAGFEAEGSGWCVLWTGLGDAAWNMAVDEWLLSTASCRPVTLRLYGWRHPTVSLGRNERWRGVVVPRELRRRGVRLVRRPTGGRAVFHHRELAYSLTADSNRHPAWSGPLEVLMARIAGALAASLQRLGVAAEVARRTQARPRTEGLCFETPTRYELLAGGHKIVGSAQYRVGSGFLQHGSLPAYPTLKDLCRLGPRADRSVREPAAREQWTARALDGIGIALARGIAGHFAARPLFGGLACIDSVAVTARVARRYGQEAWTFRR